MKYFILPSCCSVVTDAALLPCVYLCFILRSRNKERNKTKTDASIIFEEHCDKAIRETGGQLVRL